MKDYWIGLIAAVFVLLIAFGFMSLNHEKYESLTDNFSDKESDVSDKNCWVERQTRISNRSYREKVKCGSNVSYDATE